MTQQIQPFDFEGTQVRTLTDDNGAPWFVARDVCDVLGISNNRDAISQLDDDEKNTVAIADGIPGNPNKTIVNEPGLYSLVLRSRKPEAKAFKRWITHEVIPTIRRHGAYMTEQTLQHALESPDFLIQLATQLKQERAQKEQALAQVEAQKPKVLFADAVETSHTSILVGDLAKILKGNGIDIGANRLFQWLRDHEYLISRNGTDWNMPTQKSMNLKLFEIKETAITHSDGHVSVNKTPKVTGKGQTYFINKFLNEQTPQEAYE